LVGGIPTPLNNDGVRQLGWMDISNMWKNVPNHQPAMATSGRLEGSCRGTGLKKWCHPVVFVALQPLIKIDMSIKNPNTLYQQYPI
jgi:hypothetical protein